MHLIFDESGDWGDHTERYFVLGGYLTADPLRIRGVMRRAIKDVYDEYPRLKILPELKAKDTPPIAKDYILRKLAKEDLKIYYTAIDKNHVPSQNRLGSAQNRFYNYQLGILTTYIRNGNHLPAMKFLIDDRNVKVGSLNSFEDYIFIKLNFDESLSTEISVKYGLSHNYYEIQVADFICNAMWGRENYRAYDNHSNLIWGRVSSRLIFPRSVFGT
ncbi:MAG: DUF3800 domain-containing protein [Bacillota bacterium]